jgi:hypothetical protein
VRAALAAAAALVMAAPALAASVGDPGGDNRGGQLDITKVSVKQKKSGRIKAKVRFAGTTSDADGTVCLRIWRSRRAQRPLRTVCPQYKGLTDPSLRDDVDVSVVRCPPLREDELERLTICAGEVTGRADVTYDDRSLTVVFRKAAVGRKRKRIYFSAFSTSYFGGDTTSPGNPCCPDDTARRRLKLKR